MTAKGAQFIYQLCTGDELMCHAKTTIYPIAQNEYFVQFTQNLQKVLTKDIFLH